MTFVLWDHERLEHLAHELGWILHASRQIHSTNTALLEYSQHHSIHRHWWITDQQLKGKGRHGKSWHTAPGQALLNSFGWTFPRPLQESLQASLVIGLSIVRALAPYTQDAHLKWPNDILLFEKKLAGILIEVAHHSAYSTTVVIGIGLNWNSPTLDTPSQAIGLDASYPYLSIEERYSLIKVLIENINIDLQRFGADGFAPFLYDWNQFHAWTRGSAISWNDAQGCHEGYLDTLDESGYLWVINKNGQRISLGEHAYTLRPKKE